VTLSALHTEVVEHLVSLGFDRVDAESIAEMDLDSHEERESHYHYVLECDAADIAGWIGIRPKGGAA